MKANSEDISLGLIRRVTDRLNAGIYSSITERVDGLNYLEERDIVTTVEDYFNALGHKVYVSFEWNGLSNNVHITIDLPADY